MRYDAHATRGDEEEAVAFLARLARPREALELAVATGRIALPLLRAGVPVDGIEQLQHMVDRLREKPDGDNVRVLIGDMSRVGTGRSYRLVYLLYNTIGNLLTQDDQVRCFQNAARHLSKRRSVCPRVSPPQRPVTTGPPVPRRRARVGRPGDPGRLPL
jgi:hypothetical protein